MFKTSFKWNRAFLALGLPLVFLSPVFSQVSPPADSTPGFSNFQNTPVNSILDVYEQLSGKHLIRDVTLAGLPPVSINATSLSKGEMLHLIEATLLLNNVVIVSVDEKTSKAVAIGGAKNARSEGVKLYANPASLPADNQVVSFYMPLSYISPVEAQNIFMQQAPVHPYGVYIPAPSAQAIIVTENSDVVRELIGLKELIDVPPARVTTEFVQLTRADAEKVADLLNKLLDPKKDPAAPAGGGGVQVPPDLGLQAPLLNEHDLLSGPAQIVADPRSNRLLLITRPVNIPFLKQLISQLDKPDSFMEPQRRSLKYVLAQDILPAIEASLAQGKDETDQAKQDQSATGNKPPATANSATNPTPANSVGGSNQGSVAAVTSPLQAPPDNNVPTVVTVGKTRILADNRSNSVIVFGTPDAVQKVFGIVDELDQKPLQVYLATVIGQLTVSEGLEFGIDILQKFQHVGNVGFASSQITSPGTTSSASVPEPAGLLSSTGFPLPTGLTLYGAIGNTLNAYVRALETTNRFKVISRPSVYTTNNKLAVIASGSEVPVPSNTTSGFAGNNNNLVTTANITYQDVLLSLNIIPLINANHQVTLKIRQTNNSLGNNENIGGNTVPIILTQEINTEVTVPDKSTIVIGGLISDTTTRDTGGVPLLSDIPVLGYLFKDTKKTKNRNELIIMIQPTVVETDGDQIAANESEKQRTILGQEAADTATKTIPLTPQTPFSDRTLYESSDQVPRAVPALPLVPVTPSHSIVPAASSPAPDVAHGQLPPDNTAPPIPATTP